MKKFLCVMVAAFLLGGCADKTFDAKGAEALVFPEQQTYRFALKQSDNQVADAIAQMIDQAQQADRHFEVTYHYATPRGKVLARKQIAKHRRQHLAPMQYAIRSAVADSGEDLRVVVRLTRLVTETCRAGRLAHPTLRRDCFVETMRMKQIAYPEHLIRE